MNRQLHRLAVKVGTYYNDEGEEKKRWQRVGVMMEGQYGPFLLIDSTFNFAALAEEPGGSILVSMFEPDWKEGEPAPHRRKAKPKSKAKSRSRRPADDDIPF